MGGEIRCKRLRMTIDGNGGRGKKRKKGEKKKKREKMGEKEGKKERGKLTSRHAE